MRKIQEEGRFKIKDVSVLSSVGSQAGKTGDRSNDSPYCRIYDAILVFSKRTFLQKRKLLLLYQVYYFSGL
jgi:hypothetical protein